MTTKAMNKHAYWAWRGSEDPEVKVGILTINSPAGPHEVPMLDLPSAMELIKVIDAFVEQAEIDTMNRVRRAVNMALGRL